MRTCLRRFSTPGMTRRPVGLEPEPPRPRSGPAAPAQTKYATRPRRPRRLPSCPANARRHLRHRQLRPVFAPHLPPRGPRAAGRCHSAITLVNGPDPGTVAAFGRRGWGRWRAPKPRSRVRVKVALSLVIAAEVEQAEKGHRVGRAVRRRRRRGTAAPRTTSWSWTRWRRATRSGRRRPQRCCRRRTRATARARSTERSPGSRLPAMYVSSPPFLVDARASHAWPRTAATSKGCPRCVLRDAQTGGPGR